MIKLRLFKIHLVVRLYDYYPLIITERKYINRPGKPCVEDTEYVFMECVIESIVARVGCRYPWTTDHTTFPVCTTLQKIRELEEEFYTIQRSETRVVIEKTGCHVPCRHREYKIFSDEFEGSTLGGSGVAVWLLSTEFTLEEEEFIYPFISFVAEFGGALGLFLGFSFFMVWDFVVGLFHMACRTLV